MKKLLVFTAILLQSICLFAATAKYQASDYMLNVSYTDEIVPGDAVFVRMVITTPKNHKMAKADERKATLQLLKDKKVVEQAPFYTIGKKKSQTYAEMLCGVPVSLWITEANYTVKVIFSITDNEVQEFTLPAIFKTRDFNKETIELNAQNTAIKTDDSPERSAQIEKLNNILFTTIPGDVFATKKYICPTTSERYTAWCGDRRIYAYSNGKSSTSLHYGNDYGIPTGSEVRACAEGKVVMAENRISTGWSVVIEHLPGLYSLYYHNSELNVKEGDTVRQGEIIAKSGATGLATGPHLHWEMRLNGSAVRPEFFMQNFTFENE